MKRKYRESFEDFPIIAAVRDDSTLEECLKTECQNVFILYGTIMTISSIVDRITSAGKYAFVHLDMIEGLAGREIAVEFIKNNTSADGIITTKSPLIKKARELGLFAIQRFFIIDSMAIDNADKQIEHSKPDYIEILPGVIPRVISTVKKNVHPHVIAGGLISYKEDILGALDAGATAISTTNTKLWYM